MEGGAGRSRPGAQDSLPAPGSSVPSLGRGSPQQKGYIRCFLGSLLSACLLQAPLAHPSWHLDSAPVPATDSVTSCGPPSQKGPCHGPRPQRRGSSLFLSLWKVHFEHICINAGHNISPRRPEKKENSICQDIQPSCPALPTCFLGP